MSLMDTPALFRVVQPWGPDKARQATLISTHATSQEAFDAIDALGKMARTERRQTRLNSSSLASTEPSSQDARTDRQLPAKILWVEVRRQGTTPCDSLRASHH